MENSKKLDELISKIEADKEVLSVMPKNNKKNKELYKQEMENLKVEFQQYKNDVEKIIKQKYEKELKVQENKEIEVLDGRINSIEGTLDILDGVKTSYEKLELDKIIYRISKYYKENLENVNNQILSCINKFSKIGINLTVDDFNYSSFVTDYMKTFFEELNKDDINSKRIKEKFEKIYWKCPEIITHIELNIRNIYLKKQTIIDKYFENEKNKLLKEWGKTPKEILNIYEDLKRQKIEKKETDKKYLLNQFLDGKLNISNYEEKKLKSNYLKILPEELVATRKENDEVNSNIYKFLNSLKEYRSYMEFKFIIEDVKENYKNKENYKKSYLDTRKKIENLEKKLKKYNKKSVSKGIFGKKKENSKEILEKDALIDEIKKLYNELDLHRFYNKMYQNLNDNSTVYDALSLVCGSFCYLMHCIKKYNEGITSQETEEKLYKLYKFLNSPYNTLIKNLTILEEKDIERIIADRYILQDFMVKREDIDENNIEVLISVLEEIKVGANLKKAGLKSENIEQLCAAKKLFKL